MKKIILNKKNFNSDDLNNPDFVDKNEFSSYKKDKIYKFISFILLIFLLPFLIISLIIQSYCSIKNINSIKVENFNYIDRKINYNYLKDFIQNESLFINVSTKFYPKFPENNKEHFINTNYFKTNYEINNYRYNFQDIYNNRKLFLIDYSEHPYEQINRSLSFDENANKIIQTSGMLNITKLDFYYYNNTEQNIENLNHIHLSMSFDVNYILLTSVSIASILKTSSPKTYIHFHLIIVNCTYEDIKPIINLKKINSFVSFIFYNGMQAVYDFKRGTTEDRGIGEYTRFLIPEIVNNTNKILILDSGDILATRDLSEIFFFELNDNYCAFSLENVAGRFLDNVIFGRNNFYPNGGITLINVRKYRNDKLYKSAFFSSLAYEFLPCPYQDILLLISNYNFKFFPLNFNCPQLYENKEQFIKNNFSSPEIDKWLDDQKFSPFRYTKEELVNATLNPIIIHLYKSKPFYNKANEELTKLWINYGKLTGLLDKIKEKYPKPFIHKNKY